MSKRINVMIDDDTWAFPSPNFTNADNQASACAGKRHAIGVNLRHPRSQGFHLAQVGTPQRLFESEGGPWDVDPEGQRFLMIRAPRAEGPEPERPRIDVVLNWFDELGRRVRVD